MIQAAKNIGRGLIGAGVCAISLVVVKISKPLGLDILTSSLRMCDSDWC